MKFFEIKAATITDVFETSWNGKTTTTIIFKIDEGFFHIIFQYADGTSNFVLNKILQFSCVSNPSDLKNNKLCLVVVKENDSCALIGFGHKTENRFVVNDESIKSEYTFKNLCQRCSS